MAAPNVNTYTNEYKFGRGRAFFNRLSGGIYEGFRPFGNAPSLSINVTTDKFEHESSEGGINEIDYTKVIKITRAGKMDVDNVSTENQELFLAAAAGTVTQAATPVTDEVIPFVTANRTYQLGATTSNPAGIRGMSSVAVRVAQGDDASARANSTPYAKGAFYQPATPNNHYYVCTVAGTSAGSPPTFTTDGTTFADGTATFRDLGLVIVPSTADVNYKLDSDLGLLSVTPSGTIAVAAGIVAALGVAGLTSISLNVDYTPTANSRTQLVTSADASLSGQFKYIADNPDGEGNQDIFCPDVTLSPSGDFALITGNDIAKMSFDIGINKLNSTTAAIYVDGRPA